MTHRTKNEQHTRRLCVFVFSRQGVPSNLAKIRFSLDDDDHSHLFAYMCNGTHFHSLPSDDVTNVAPEIPTTPPSDPSFQLLFVVFRKKKKKIPIGHWAPLCVLFIYFYSNEEGRHRRASCSVNLANNYFHGRSVRRSSSRCTPYGFLSARLFRDADALRCVCLSIIPTHTRALLSNAAFHTSTGTPHNPKKERRAGLTCCPRNSIKEEATHLETGRDSIRLFGVKNGEQTPNGQRQSVVCVFSLLVGESTCTRRLCSQLVAISSRTAGQIRQQRD